MTEINLQDPFQARRWLGLVIPDDACGFRLKPNVILPATELGFSCTTNRLGLRGPCDEQASNVIFGTSYAMGIAVSNGQNWYDLALPRLGWLNLGLPVGIREWSELARRYHRGLKRRAILMYHPNIWVHCLMYERWRASETDVFRALGWRRDRIGCLSLSLRRWRERPGKISRGETIQFEENGRQYQVDARYAAISPTMHRELIERNLGILLTLLGSFDEVLCVRVTVKQELVPAAHRNVTLDDTVATYNALWDKTKEALATLPGARTIERLPFTLEDYQLCDSHWNAKGNARFAQWVQSAVGFTQS